MTYSDAQIWAVIVPLGIGTYLVRLSFLGLIGGRRMPGWVLRHLRYTPVAILPGLVAPLAVWPAATGGEPDAVRLAAALVTLLLRLRPPRLVPITELLALLLLLLLAVGLDVP